MVQRATLETRLAVRRALVGRPVPEGAGSAPLVLVALSGGADSLALAAATAFEARGAGVRAGAIVVDHGLQEGSAAVAARAAEQGAGLGLDPVLVRRVEVVPDRGDGPEAAAREARYGAFARAAGEAGARAILTAHTRDDQAEQVLLALARGSGLRSLAGIPDRRGLDGGAVILRPFLGEKPSVTRATTAAACIEQGLEPWRDPHNDDPSYARVRVRRRVLPQLERELGPGVAEALARTADLAREDADALDALAEEIADEALADEALAGAPLADPVPADPGPGGAGLADPAAEPFEMPVAVLSELPAALRGRVIRSVASRRFGSHLSREHTLAVAALVTDWRGQGPIDVPGAAVARRGSLLVFTAR
ncbi:tRNA lysidine(34) synthetase TilS [Leucobacter sp. wl10]|uniref:tRNA lysidine(34) synthetase TilS n=1 Tax=Leucobacter sp. wl10 TaxID=2304677 RepID=UPI000E5AF3DB|nr:tRNA lysidine(34) synthetase TilS [Leucobacter sp. wl10]RGE20319.1 tRNA lysidine(34) synthetase TilS [Leucobacter sp. wl10]